MLAPFIMSACAVCVHAADLMYALIGWNIKKHIM